MTRVTLLLIRPLVRAIDWIPLVWAAAFATGLVVLIGSIERPLPTCDALPLLRMSAGILGAAAGFSLVDPMAYGTAPVPSPRWLRMWLRTALAAGTALGLWGAGFVIATLYLPHGSRLLVGDVTLEAAVCVLTGLSGAAVAVRIRPGHGRSAALLGAAVQSTLLVITLFLTADLWLWPLQSDLRWPGAHQAWLGLLPLPLACLAVAHRDLAGGTRQRPGNISSRTLMERFI